MRPVANGTAHFSYRIIFFMIVLGLIVGSQIAAQTAGRWVAIGGALVCHSGRQLYTRFKLKSIGRKEIISAWLEALPELSVGLVIYALPIIRPQVAVTPVGGYLSRIIRRVSLNRPASNL